MSASFGQQHAGEGGETGRVSREAAKKKGVLSWVPCFFSHRGHRVHRGGDSRAGFFEPRMNTDGHGCLCLTTHFAWRGCENESGRGDGVAVTRSCEASGQVLSGAVFKHRGTEGTEGGRLRVSQSFARLPGARHFSGYFHSRVSREATVAGLAGVGGRHSESACYFGWECRVCDAFHRRPRLIWRGAVRFLDVGLFWMAV
jgi:hypothetical protein